MKTRTVRRVLVAGALLVLLGVGGFLVAASGIVPIQASSGHWAITEWFLQFSKRRSVSLHSIPIDQLDLSAPWLVLKGAGHYENGCRPCHGGPDLPTPRIAAAMTPGPPYLPPLIASWEPEELFYIVKHGIKFTGMPAWPAQERDDEVRAVVAFLLTMPELDGAAYERLVHGDAPEEPTVAPLEELEPAGPPGPITATCARCHGVNGEGRGTAAFPKLAGQQAEYLFGALEAFASGARHSGIMEPIAVALSEAERREISAYYSGLRGLPGALGGELTGGAGFESGQAIADRGVPELGVPSCADCHGPADHSRNPAYPTLSGQYADYLVLQLALFKEGRRGGSSYASIMHHVVPGFDAEEILDVAAYYAASPGGGGGVER